MKAFYCSNATTLLRTRPYSEDRGSRRHRAAEWPHGHSRRHAVIGAVIGWGAAGHEKRGTSDGSNIGLEPVYFRFLLSIHDTAVAFFFFPRCGRERLGIPTLALKAWFAFALQSTVLFERS